jgi:hypothetical protein
MRNAYIRFLSQNLKRGEHLEDIGANKKIILKSILKKWFRRVCTELIWPRIQSSENCCGAVNETSEFHKIS